MKPQFPEQSRRPCYPGGIQKPGLKYLMALLLVFLAAVSPGLCEEFGLKTYYREIGRLHSDSNSIGSKFVIQGETLLLDAGKYESWAFLHTVNSERFALAHPDGTRYFSVDFLRHKPRLKYRTDGVNIDLAVLLVDVDRKNELYSQLDHDNRHQFVLPSILGSYELGSWEFQLGGWEETDIQPFDYHRYTVYLLRTYSAGARFRFLEDHSVKLDYRIIDRVYPVDFELTKNEIDLSWQLKNVLEIKNILNWQEVSLGLVQSRYTDTETNKVDLTNRFKFKLFGLNHFLMHRFRYTDTITTYREGIYKYSLIELDEKKNDLWQQIEYAGFWRVSASNFFLSWKLKVEDSLVENVILDQQASVQLVYAF